MVERNFELEQHSENRSSTLRREFESLKGKFLMRNIDLDYVTPEIKDLHERPEYSPRLTVFQIRELEDGRRLVFHEIIFTSNDFLVEFERFLREKAVDIKAVGFDKTPPEFLYFFNLPFSLIPVDIERIEVISTASQETIKIGEEERMRGVDFSSSSTLRMIEPTLIDEKLAEIEKKGVFTVVVEESENDEGDLVAFEYRWGNEFKTVNHILFRQESKQENSQQTNS